MDDYSNIVAATRAYESGRNVIQELKSLRGKSIASEIDIEIAYELQTGTYIEFAKKDLDRWAAYGQEIASFLDPHLKNAKKFLDCGSGELTSLCSTLNAVSFRPLEVTAVDISWSRLHRGSQFWRRFSTSDLTPDLVVADMETLPFPDDSFDVTMTVHALEPNGGRESILIAELLRVSSKKLVLFEPCFERANRKARKRMKRNGYVRKLEAHLNSLGARILNVSEFALPDTPLNPTWVIEVEPNPRVPEKEQSDSFDIEGFLCPVTGTCLLRKEDWLVNPEYGLIYPVLKEIPLLRRRNAVFAKEFLERI